MSGLTRWMRVVGVRPAQTALHYQAQLFYTVAQVPLLVVVVWMSGRRTIDDSGGCPTDS